MLHLLAAFILGATAALLPFATRTSSATTVPIVIHDGSALVETQISSGVTTVGDALLELGITTGGMLVTPPLTDPLLPGLTITLLRERTVHVHDGVTSYDITVMATNIGQALAEAHIVLGRSDRVEPPLAAALHSTITISITRVREEDRTDLVPIPFSIQVTEDPELPWGEERIVQKGREGQAKEFVHYIYENGDVISREVLERSVLEEPTAEQRVRGTKIVVGRVVEGAASWYRFRGCSCAAATIFPRGSWLRVTSLLDGQQAIVRVNDWGPDPTVHPDRVIDLDATVFRRFAPLWKGVIPVRVEHILSE